MMTSIPYARRPASVPSANAPELASGRVGRGSRGPASQRRVSLLLLALGCALGMVSQPLMAVNAACNRARQMVEEVAAMPRQSDTDHRQILVRLGTARELCPSLGQLWLLSHCSALALGDGRKAESFKKRAAFSGVEQMICPGAEPPAPVLGPVRRKFALVVGIGSFLDSAIPQLRFTAKDATDFANFLVQQAHFPAGSVTLLTDQDATRAKILSALQQLILVAAEDDLVVLYLSSHGSPYQKSQGLKGVGYLVTHDTFLDSIWVDAIEYQALAAKVALLQARRVVTFLDSCFSGQALARGAKQLVVEGAGIDQRTAERFLSGEGTYVVTSSRADERSWESEELGNSYFTHYLIDSLQGSVPPTLGEAFARLADRVNQAVVRDRGFTQRPEIQPSGGVADLRLGVVPLFQAP